MLTTQEIRQLQEKEWNEELSKSLNELLKARFNLKSGHAKESHNIRQLQKHIARLKTVRKEQDLEEKANQKNKAEAPKPVKVMKVKPVKKMAMPRRTKKKIKKPAKRRLA